MSQVVNKKYNIWITSLDATPLVKGYLTGVKGSSIIVSPIKTKSTIELGVINIKDIKFRRRGQIWKSALGGAVAGALVGYLVGQKTIKEEKDKLFSLHKEQRLLLTGSTTAGGALIGGLIGSIKMKIPINGNQEVYNIEKKKSKLFKGFD